MRKSRNVRHVPHLAALESRCMLTAGPVAAWIGQDGHDFAGGLSPQTGNGVQDIHVGLSALPADRAIVSLDVRGFGGGDWPVNIGAYNVYNGVLFRTSGSTTAELYLDPYINESGRQFFLTLNYDNGTSVSVTMNGGTADANLRMPADAVAITWNGQDGQDLTAPTSAVGPDGVQDVHLVLSRLFPSIAIRSVNVSTNLGVAWESGLNPNLNNNAELIRRGPDPSIGDFYFSPDRDLNGLTLSVDVTYEDGKLDHTTFVAGHSSTTLAMPSPVGLVPLWDTFHATWLGQDGLNLIGAGDVHVALDSLPANRTVVAVTLSDSSGLDWSYNKPGSGLSAADPSAHALGFQTPGDATKADLTFPPNHDESGKSLTVVVTLDNGNLLATHLSGGSSDPGLRAANAERLSVVAHPGDDLNDLANRFGVVRLVAGLYPMNQPLVLSHAVTIKADPGATLLFSQAATSPTWTAAIKVLASHTMLDGFAVRFAGPVRWKDGISYGPAVVGAADNFDPWSADPLIGLTFTHLDLQSPPASTSWEEAPHLLRLVSAESGSILGNRLKGGTTEFLGGPWTISGNQFLGTPVNTFTYAAFAGHYTHDLTLSGNFVQPSGPSGKTWRFLVLTQNGRNDVISNNIVVGVGPMDSDSVANPNAPEVILTEAYRLHYEGMAAGISADGLVVQIPTPQNGPARTGDVVAILSGPQAGQWRTIIQALSPTSYLLDAPITPGTIAISIATGFANETFKNNSVDSRGSSIAADLVLAGNEFGVSVVGNHFVGGNDGFRISAYPTEQPNFWGWSYAPVLGATILGNTVQDTLRGGIIDVEHSVYAKTTAGRVYFSGSVQNNVGVWTPSFAAARSAIAGLEPPALVTIGDSLSHDPGEIQLSVSGNQVQGPASVVTQPTFVVVAGTINGIATRNRASVLPVVPAGPLALPKPAAATPDQGTPTKISARNATSIPAVFVPLASGAPATPSKSKSSPSNTGAAKQGFVSKANPSAPAHSHPRGKLVAKIAPVQRRSRAVNSH